MGIIHPEGLYHDKLGNHNGMPGHHHGSQVSYENLIPSGELQLGKGKCRQGACEENTGC